GAVPAAVPLGVAELHLAAVLADLQVAVAVPDRVRQQRAVRVEPPGRLLAGHELLRVDRVSRDVDVLRGVVDHGQPAVGDPGRGEPEQLVLAAGSIRSVRSTVWTSGTLV